MAGDEVGQDEYADPRLAVVRYHRGQVAQHQPEPGRVVVGVVHAPAQEIKIQQSVRLTALLQKVGDLRGNRALPRAIDPVIRTPSSLRTRIEQGYGGTARYPVTPIPALSSVVHLHWRAGRGGRRGSLTE